MRHRILARPPATKPVKPVCRQPGIRELAPLLSHSPGVPPRFHVVHGEHEKPGFGVELRRGNHVLGDAQVAYFDRYFTPEPAVGLSDLERAILVARVGIDARHLVRRELGNLVQAKIERLADEDRADLDKRQAAPASPVTSTMVGITLPG